MQIKSSRIKPCIWLLGFVVMLGAVLHTSLPMAFQALFTLLWSVYGVVGIAQLDQEHIQELLPSSESWTLLCQSRCHQGVVLQRGAIHPLGVTLYWSNGLSLWLAKDQCQQSDYKAIVRALRFKCIS